MSILNSFHQEKTKGPSKQTDRIITLKIISLANNCKHHIKNFITKYQRIFLLKLKSKACLKNVTSGEKAFLTKNNYENIYQIFLWNPCMKTKCKKKWVQDEWENIQETINKSKRVIDFINEFYNNPIELVLSNGKIYRKHIRRSAAIICINMSWQKEHCLLYLSQLFL